MWHNATLTGFFATWKVWSELQQRLRELEITNKQHQESLETAEHGTVDAKEKMKHEQAERQKYSSYFNSKDFKTVKFDEIREGFECREKWARWKRERIKTEGEHDQRYARLETSNEKSDVGHG